MTPPLPMRSFVPSRKPGPVTRLRGRLVKVTLLSGEEAIGRLEEASRFELVLLAANGRLVVIFKHAVATILDVTEARP